jgi:hypothetical protein
MEQTSLRVGRQVTLAGGDIAAASTRPHIAVQTVARSKWAGGDIAVSTTRLHTAAQTVAKPNVSPTVQRPDPSRANLWVRLSTGIIGSDQCRRTGGEVLYGAAGEKRHC